MAPIPTFGVARCLLVSGGMFGLEEVRKHPPPLFRAKREHLKRSERLPESQGHKLALTVLHVAHSMDSGGGACLLVSRGGMLDGQEEVGQRASSCSIANHRHAPIALPTNPTSKKIVNNPDSADPSRTPTRFVPHRAGHDVTRASP